MKFPFHFRLNKMSPVSVMDTTVGLTSKQSNHMSRNPDKFKLRMWHETPDSVIRG